MAQCSPRLAGLQQAASFLCCSLQRGTGAEWTQLGRLGHCPGVICVLLESALCPFLSRASRSSGPHPKLDPSSELFCFDSGTQCQGGVPRLFGLIEGCLGLLWSFWAC